MRIEVRSIAPFKSEERISIGIETGAGIWENLVMRTAAEMGIPQNGKTTPHSIGWAGPAASLEAQRWRTAVGRAAIWLIKDINGGLNTSSTSEQFTCIQQLTLALIAKEPSPLFGAADYGQPDTQFMDSWREARGDASDRKTVAAMLGRAFASDPKKERVSLAGHRRLADMGSRHASHWLNRIVNIAWFTLKNDDWPNEVDLVFSSYADSINSNRKDLYIPWLADEQQGLYDDLIVFMTSFCTTRRAMGRPDLFAGAHAAVGAQACIFLRALALVAPESMPGRSMDLLDDMESLIDMNALDEISRHEYRLRQLYGRVRAAWEKNILQGVEPNEDAPEVRRGRIL
jgi:hypothetical protein